MTFSELKTFILDKSKRGGLCEDFHNVYVATDYNQLISATKPLFIYGWRGGIVNTDILDEVDDSYLVAHGILYNKTGIQTVSGNMVCVGGTPNLTYTGTTKNKINVIQSNPTITVDGPYLEAKVFNSQGTFNIDSVAEIYSDNFDNQLVTVNAEGYVSIFADHKSNLAVNFGIDAFVKLFMRKNSLAEVSIESTDLRIFAIASDKSQINYLEL